MSMHSIECNTGIFTCINRTIHCNEKNYNNTSKIVGWSLLVQSSVAA